MYEQLLTGARALQSQTVAMRRDIHREPELGWICHGRGQLFWMAYPVWI